MTVTVKHTKMKENAILSGYATIKNLRAENLRRNDLETKILRC